MATIRFIVCLLLGSLAIPAGAKAELLELTPWTYIGKAAELARRI